MSDGRTLMGQTTHTALLAERGWWLRHSDGSLRVLRDGKWHDATEAEYIAETGDECRGAGCDRCRI